MSARGDTPPLILGSGSARRLELLGLLGLKPDIVLPADIDETPKKGEHPEHYAIRMANEKADKLVKQHPDACILTADTVVAKGRTILPKAETEDDVLFCLEQLSGRSHRVYTAVAGSHGAFRKVQVAQTRVAVKRLSDNEIAWYAHTRQGVGCAGGYALQGYFSIFVHKIIGSYSAVIGLPLYETNKIFHDLGICLEKTALS